VSGDLKKMQSKTNSRVFEGNFLLVQEISPFIRKGISNDFWSATYFTVNNINKKEDWSIFQGYISQSNAFSTAILIQGFFQVFKGCYTR